MGRCHGSSGWVTDSDHCCKNKDAHEVPFLVIPWPAAGNASYLYTLGKIACHGCNSYPYLLRQHVSRIQHQPLDPSFGHCTHTRLTISMLTTETWPNWKTDARCIAAIQTSPRQPGQTGPSISTPQTSKSTTLLNYIRKVCPHSNYW